MGTIVVSHDSVPGVEEGEARLLATPVQARDRELIVVVGTTLADRNEALNNLRNLLLIGGPIALLLASLAGYGVTTLALRPVERMRRQAADISTAEPGVRLPVPPTDDEIGRLGNTLNAMLARLEQAFQRERTFASDASHELRTPLAVLKTELELAIGRGRSRDELEAALRSAVEETDRLVQLAEDLLVIARFDQGRLPVRLAAVEVDDVLADVRERFAIRSRETDRALVADAPDGLRLTADPERLRQALGNMVDNAFRHGRGTVRLSARTVNSHVELHVSDEGPGFPDDFLAPRSSASPARTRVAAGAARGSGSRSWRRSPALTAARRARPTGPVAARTCGSSCPRPTVESGEFRGIDSARGGPPGNMDSRADRAGRAARAGSGRAGRRGAHVRGRATSTASRTRSPMQDFRNKMAALMDASFPNRASLRAGGRGRRREPPAPGRPRGAGQARWSCSPRTPAWSPS